MSRIFICTMHIFLDRYAQCYYSAFQHSATKGAMMFGTNTASIEKRTFRADLNRFLDAEAAAERRAELIEEQALYLVQEGQEFHPWTFEHFEEAMGNASRGDRIVVFATVASATDLHLDNHVANRTALIAIKGLVENYWLDCARQEAEKN